MSNKKRLLIIGLDGATWDIIDPLVEQGRLPTFQHLKETGIYNHLRSTVPPATFPAWTTFMTGKNPGKHAIFDFTERIKGSYRLRFVNATFRRCKTIWHMLSEHGCRVGVMGLPATYPPENINGFMISGFDSPVSKGIDQSFVTPLHFYDEIQRIAGGYKISDLLETFMDKNWHSNAYGKILESLDNKASLALSLYGREPWDCFMVLFGESDTASHHFWKFHDTASPRFEAGMEHLSEAISEVYEKIDGILKKFLDNLPKDTAVLLVSDHGFGGISNRAVSINKWLEQESLLDFKDRSSLVDRGMGIVKRAGLKRLPHGIQEKIFRTPLKSLAQRMESRSRFSGINWHTTTAFSEELNYFPSIYLNVAGREPQGTVSQGKMYENLREKIIEKILSWKDPETGTSIVRSAWKREDIYSGPYVDNAPDIILDLHTVDGYSYICLPSTYFPSDEPFKKLEKDEQCGPRLLSMSGSHRQDGIFLFSCDDLNVTGKLNQHPNIQDICPSILSFFKVPLDGEMDGSVLEPFKDMGTRTGRPILSGKDSSPPPTPYTPEQEKRIKERLKNLGYLD